MTINGFEIIPFYAERHLCFLEELTELLHQAYSPLATEGMHYLASHQSASKTLERLQEGDSWLFFSNRELIGSVSLYEGIKKKISADYYLRPGVFLFGQFAVKQEFQGCGVGSKAMDFLEAQARNAGAKELALDTSERAGKLIVMYKNRGYEVVSSTQWPNVNYRSLILSKRLWSH